MLMSNEYRIWLSTFFVENHAIYTVISTSNDSYSLGTPVSSTNKTDLHDIAEILLKMALYTRNQPTTIHPLPM